MGTKIQPIALRLGQSVSWKSNWQAQSDEYADMTFRDNQLQELMRNFLRQHGILMGDLYIQVNTEVPISLNKEQKELLEKFREIENEKSNPSIKKFFQKAKSFWKN